MNPRIVTFNFCEDFIKSFVDYFRQNYIVPQKDLRRVAIVFGGRRPGLFVKRELARIIKKGFIPPRIFTIDEFISYSASKRHDFRRGVDLEQSYNLFQLAKEHAPEILTERKKFSQFLPWAREILAFIDQLDLELKTDKDLELISQSAVIGYPVPDDINRLLEKILILRKCYHQRMLEEKVFSRGFQYFQAATSIESLSFDEYDEILFCNFFYLNKAEQTIMKNLYDRKKAILFFQGDERKWPAFKRVNKLFGSPVWEGDVVTKPKFKLNLYAGFDTHSQVGIAREILKKIDDHRDTVIVLPHAQLIVPLLSEIGSLVKDFNISMGYPLKRSSLYSLLNFIFEAQASQDARGYYSRDYLKVLRHPLVKNLIFLESSAIARVLIHKTEEILTGQEQSSVSGSSFIAFEDIAGEDVLFELTKETLLSMGLDVSHKALREIIEEIHQVLFENWEEVGNFCDFAECLKKLMDVLIHKSYLANYPLNARVAERILDIKDELKSLKFAKEDFPLEDMLRIFKSKLDREIVAFSGSPLKGLQILGLFETRALSFKNVIVLDANEGILPHLNIYEPLIPREVMIGLNLDRLELEEEIQRYQFMRLISSAKNVHLIYQESKERERSRFIEEVVWEKEKHKNKVGVIPVLRGSYELQASLKPKEVKKTKEMIDMLKNHRYSASSINMYLRNPMEFYFNYVLSLREREDLLEEPENMQVGSFIHELLEETFQPFLKKRPIIDAKFRKFFMDCLEKKFEATFSKTMKSDAFLLRTVIFERMKRFLDHEANSPERQIKEIVSLEEAFDDTLDLPVGPIKFVYKMDRIDRLRDDTIFVLDYKTGSTSTIPKAIEVINKMPLSRVTIFENIKSFQIPLYIFYLNKIYEGQNVDAGYYNLRTLEISRFFDRTLNWEFDHIKSAFYRSLDFIFREIFDPNVPFVEGEGY